MFPSSKSNNSKQRELDHIIDNHSIQILMEAININWLKKTNPFP